MKNLLSISASLLLASTMSATIITFDEGGTVEGQVITNQYTGLTISATRGTSETGPAADAVTINSDADSTTEDWDLLRKSHNGYNGNQTNDTEWDGGGNLASTTELGNLLIVQDDQRSAQNNGVYLNPDDEVGSRITFDFVEAIFNFGFDFIDIEGTESLMVEFWTGDSSRFSVSSFTLSGNTASYGNNSINSTALKDLRGLGVDKVVFAMSGSGAIDNVRYNVSDSGTTLALLGAGLLGLVGVRRRFSK